MLMFLVGCATMPTKEEIAKLNYGMAPTIDCQQVIKDYFSNALVDPYSAVYEFENTPTQYWYKEPPLMGGKLYAGYMVSVKVNAKNRMGGYTGKKQYIFIFNNNSIIKIIDSEESAPW